MVRLWCRSFADQLDFSVDYQPWVVANFSGILCVDEVYQGELALLLGVDPAAPDGDRLVGRFDIVFWPRFEVGHTGLSKADVLMSHAKLGWRGLICALGLLAIESVAATAHQTTPPPATGGIDVESVRHVLESAGYSVGTPVPFDDQALARFESGSARRRV